MFPEYVGKGKSKGDKGRELVRSGERFCIGQYIKKQGLFSSLHKILHEHTHTLRGNCNKNVGLPIHTKLFSLALVLFLFQKEP